MTALCKMTNERVKMPCSYAGCPLFGDCLVAYEKATVKPKTNADHIRSMTDEELAKILSTACLGCPVVGCKLHNYASYGCEKAFENWLKQPYEEENHGKA